VSTIYGIRRVNGWKGVGRGARGGEGWRGCGREEEGGEDRRGEGKGMGMGRKGPELRMDERKPLPMLATRGIPFAASPPSCPASARFCWLPT
jgi:hypothetical protein